MKNSSGNFISPAPASVSAALATAKIPDDFRFSMVNSSGANAYPIAGASWVLIYQTQKNSDHGQKLVNFLKWAITDGQKISSTLDYAPLPDALQQRELTLLAYGKRLTWLVSSVKIVSARAGTKSVSSRSLVFVVSK